MMSGISKLLKLKILPVILLTGIFIFTNNFQSARAETLRSTDRSLTVYALGKKFEFFYPEIDFCGDGFYLKNAEEIVDGIYYSTLLKPKDAEVIIDGEKEYPFEFKSEVLGECIDKEDLLVKIASALKRGKSEVVAKKKVLKPSITAEILKNSTYRRAFFSTSYQYSTEERKFNIALCAKYMGGVTLFDGEVFSFNQAVGERTSERGFKSAKIIENGKFTDGIGGGVCQVSSTLYNSALLAGLDVVERHPHSMLVSYVEPSFDAMVSSDYADLKIANRTGGFIFIIPRATADSISVEVFGQKTDYSYKRVSTVKEKTEPEEIERIESDEVEAGKEIIAVYPKQGAITEGYLEVYKSGKLIKTILLSHDKYKPLRGLIKYNGLTKARGSSL